jgi:small subunit ribosomal protein S6
MHMRHYEAVIIYDLAFEPQAIQAQLDKALEVITSSGGAVEGIERWGRRPFAYEVKHKREGYYVIVSLSTEVAGLSALDRMLSLADEVLRHKLIRIPDKVAAARAAVA